MREAIEQVIEDLQESICLMEKVLKGYCTNPGYAIGVIETNRETIRRLKAVLADETGDSGNVAGNK